MRGVVTKTILAAVIAGSSLLGKQFQSVLRKAESR